MQFPTRSLIAGAVVGAVAASGGAVLMLSGSAGGGVVEVPVPTFAPAPPGSALAAPTSSAPVPAAPVPSGPVTGADIAAQGLPAGGPGAVTRRSTAEAEERAEFVDRLPERLRDRIRAACAADELDGEICDYV